MTDNENCTIDARQAVRFRVSRLAGIRKRPCLALIIGNIVRGDVVALRGALGGLRGGAIDVVLYSTGGEIDGAYLIAREIRRWFERVTIFVPHMAKSAATLICLAADELVLGDMGELGPLDSQSRLAHAPGIPTDGSGLLPFRALEQMDTAVLSRFGRVVSRSVEAAGVSPTEVLDHAANLVGRLYAPIYGRIDPIRVAESARGLEYGEAYASRLLRRYRPDIDSMTARAIVHKLIHDYPSHGFILDHEELCELGLPSRPPVGAESETLDPLAPLLITWDDRGPDLVELFLPDQGAADEDDEDDDDDDDEPRAPERAAVAGRPAEGRKPFATGPA